MTIIVKGEKVVFKMRDGSQVRPPAGYGMVHDPDGKQLPKCVVFVGPVRRTQQPVESKGASKAYFGKLQLRQAIIDRPGNSWKEIGECVEILYVRKGRYAGSYFHPFHKFAPTLLKCGKFYRLELRNGCIVDDRGFVFP